MRFKRFFGGKKNDLGCHYLQMNLWRLGGGERDAPRVSRDCTGDQLQKPLKLGLYELWTKSRKAAYIGDNIGECIGDCYRDY